MLLTAEKISKSYGTKQLLSEISLYLDRGQKVGVIGINGTGKSTLLKLLAGGEEPDEGRISLDPGVKMAVLPQEPPFCADDTVLDYVLSGLPAEERGPRGYEARTLLNRLDVGFFDRPMGRLSGGQRKRAALARTLLQPADVLLLDEPTNHLDIGMIRELEERLIRFQGGLIMVTHDRYFLQNVCNRIVELSLGASYEYEANWEQYLALKLERLEIAAAGERKRQTLLRREQQWMLRGARARGTKAKAHIRNYETLAAGSAPESEETQQAVTALGSRLGKTILSLEHIGKELGGRTVLCDFSYTLLRNDRIAVIGPNGSGKSTFLNLLAGTLEPDRGSRNVGQTVKIGYFAQGNAALDPSERAVDYIRGIGEFLDTADGRLSAVMLMEQFLFGSALQYSPIGKLSGGEKRRLYLLGILMSAPNVLLLDEPTNDLDTATLAILEDYLQQFPGPVIAVSHDRYFLDKIAAQTFELRGDSELRRYNGAYSDYEAARDAEKAAEARSSAAAGTAPAQRTPSAGRGHAQKLKFTYQEQKDFETIDARIADAEERLASLEREMASCTSDYVRLQALSEEKNAAEAALDALTERWLYLTELKEKIDAGSEA